MRMVAPPGATCINIAIWAAFAAVAFHGVVLASDGEGGWSTHQV